MAKQQILQPLPDNALLQSLKERLEIVREKEACEESLAEFIKKHWHIVEPETPLVWGWPLDAICLHLEAITFGIIRKVIFNVPPGFMKSLCVCVFWPAWEWGPQKMPHLRYLNFSYSQRLTVRDNGRFLKIILHDDYQAKWGDVFQVEQESVIKVSNDKTGWKIASSIGGMGTGERADRILIDDANSTDDSESEAVMLTTNTWLRETMPDRLNNMQTGVIVNIQQRTSEDDATNTLLEYGTGYVHVMVPMEFDSMRKCSTDIGWEDPRTEEGELAWEERFSYDVVKGLQKIKGPYAYAGQYQQIPAPRGGGIIKREWWQLWPPEGEEEIWMKQVKWRGKDGTMKVAMQPSYPDFEYVVASFDTAFKEKEENDPSACVVLGVFKNRQGLSKIMLVEVWNERLAFNDLLEKTIATCRRRKVDVAIIEDKASGQSILQEMQRICSPQEFQIFPYPADTSKTARAHAVVPLFSANCVYAPDRSWVDACINQCSSFPKAKHDDMVDALTMGLGYLRKLGLALMPEETQRAEMESSIFTGNDPDPLYPV
jgi:predicted phage terminase large subunit-like protein